MAFFSRKKPPTAAGEGASGNGAGESDGGEGFQAQPEKARTWFNHARTYADTGNFEGALTYYASGIKLDPETMSAHEAMYETAIKYANKAGKPAARSEIKSLEEPNNGSKLVAKFAAAEFAWMKDINNFHAAIGMMDTAVKANLKEFGHWIAPKVLNLLRKQKKISKGSLLQSKDLFAAVGAWDQALMAGELARQLDPTDNTLAQELKDLAAQRAIDAGKYERAGGKEGGFREFVKDMDKQQELEAMDSVSGSGTAEERNFERARKAYETNPQNPDAINAYAQLVKKQGTAESDKLAHEIYLKGYQDTGEYRFRMLAGDIQIERLEKKLKELTDAGSDAAAQAHKDLMELRSSEFRERAEKYPTDRSIKVRLGLVEFELGRFEDAMAQFQAAKDEPKLRATASHMLGRCFAAEGWHMEAMDEFKEALARLEPSERHRELEVRYDLMASQMAHARAERDIGLAREALQNCTEILRKDIAFRDIRARRKELDTLIRELGDTSAPASPA